MYVPYVHVDVFRLVALRMFRARAVELYIESETLYTCVHAYILRSIHYKLRIIILLVLCVTKYFVCGCSILLLYVMLSVPHSSSSSVAEAGSTHLFARCSVRRRCN